MRIIVATLASVISVNTCVGVPANAMDLDPQTTCGSPNEEISDDVRGTLDAKAQTLARLASAQFYGELQNTQREIMVRENRSDAYRLIQYLAVVSCKLIVADDELTTDDKLSRIATLKHMLQQPYNRNDRPREDQRHAQTYSRKLTEDMLIPNRKSRAGGIRFYDPPTDTVLVNNRSFPADFRVTLPGVYAFRLDGPQKQLRLACALSDDILPSARYALRVLGDNNTVFEETYSR